MEVFNVNSVTDLVELIQDVLGLPVTELDVTTHFDQLDGWDSLYTLRLITSIESQTGSKVPVSAFLQAHNIQEVYNLIT
jgi:acyl carrier protein